MINKILNFLLVSSLSTSNSFLDTNFISDFWVIRTLGSVKPRVYFRLWSMLLSPRFKDQSKSKFKNSRREDRVTRCSTCSPVTGDPTLDSTDNVCCDSWPYLELTLKLTSFPTRLYDPSMSTFPRTSDANSKSLYSMSTSSLPCLLTTAFPVKKLCKLSKYSSHISLIDNNINMLFQIPLTLPLSIRIGPPVRKSTFSFWPGTRVISPSTSFTGLPLGNWYWTRGVSL